jgi:hypothetical protein
MAERTFEDIANIANDAEEVDYGTLDREELKSYRDMFDELIRAHRSSDNPREAAKILGVKRMTDEDIDWLTEEGRLKDFQDNLRRVDEALAALEPTPPPRRSRSSSPVKSAAGERSPSPAGSPRATVSAGVRGRAGSVTRKEAKPEKVVGRSKSPKREEKGGKATSADKVVPLGPGVYGLKLAALGLDKRAYDAFWNYIVPGASYKSDENATDKVDKARRRAVVIRELVANYKDPYVNASGVSKLSEVIKLNMQLISELHETIVTLSVGLAKYGNEASLSALFTTKAGEKNYEGNSNDIKYLENQFQQRMAIDRYLRRAKSTRDPTEKPSVTQFKGNNTRILLTPEAVAWVKAEQFKIPANLSVEYNGKKYDDLKVYMEDVLDVDFNKTFLYKGRVTRGNYLSLLRIAAKKVSTEAGEKAKYDYTKAMKDNFLDKPATLTKVNKNKVNNTSDDSVIDIITDQTNDPNKFSDKYLLNTGFLSLLTLTYYRKEDALAKEPRFFGDYKNNAEELDRFIEESRVIAEFYDAYSENKTQSEKKPTKGKRGIRR